MEVLKQSFECSDAAGKSYTVYEYVEMIDGGRGTAPIEGLGRLVLSNGHAVNDNGDGTFLIVRTDTTIRPS